MKANTFYALAVAGLASAAPDALNIGGDGTGRGKAQTYQMAGGKADAISLRLNLYDKDVGDAGWEFHGDVALSVVDALDKQWYEMGWCFRPITEDNSSTPFDCLQILFYYAHDQIEVFSSAGYSEQFIGSDVFGPRLDTKLMAPSDLSRLFLDKDTDSADSDKSGAWTINTAKSYKLCTSRGNCTFNAHFYRNF